MNENERIIQAVADVWGMPREKLFLRTRSQPVCIARQTAMFMLYCAGNTISEIREIFCLKAHGTVSNGIEVIKNLGKNDIAAKKLFEAIDKTKETANED
jgi:chromosomal replication initiation ATPase DnaA